MLPNLSALKYEIEDIAMKRQRDSDDSGDSSDACLLRPTYEDDVYALSALLLIKQISIMYSDRQRQYQLFDPHYMQRDPKEREAWKRLGFKYEPYIKGWIWTSQDVVLPKILAVLSPEPFMVYSSLTPRFQVEDRIENGESIVTIEEAYRGETYDKRKKWALMGFQWDSILKRWTGSPHMGNIVRIWTNAEREWRVERARARREEEEQERAKRAEEERLRREEQERARREYEQERARREEEERLRREEQERVRREEQEQERARREEQARLRREEQERIRREEEKARELTRQKLRELEQRLRTNAFAVCEDDRAFYVAHARQYNFPSLETLIERRYAEIRTKIQQETPLNEEERNFLSSQRNEDIEEAIKNVRIEIAEREINERLARTPAFSVAKPGTMDPSWIVFVVDAIIELMEREKQSIRDEFAQNGYSFFDSPPQIKRKSTFNTPLGQFEYYVRNQPAAGDDLKWSIKILNPSEKEEVNDALQKQGYQQEYAQIRDSKTLVIAMSTIAKSRLRAGNHSLRETVYEWIRPKLVNRSR